jgi:amino acid transporter
VKGWSAFDAFGYSFFSVNLVTLGMFYSLAIFAFVPDGSVLSALVLSGVTMTFLCIVYAGLIAVMPRAGGDYVWQTRIFDGVPGAVVAARGRRLTGYLAANAFALGDTIAIIAGVVGVVIGLALGMRRGGIGFVLSSTGWWFILALWAPIYGYILNIEFLQPLAAIAGATDLLTFLGSQAGTFTVSIITIVIASGAVALGMAGYARIQRVSIYIGLIALAAMFILMIVSSQDTFKAAFDREGQSLFGVSNAYQATIDNAVANDAFVARRVAARLRARDRNVAAPAIHDVLDPVPELGATLYGEVRGAGDFRKVLNGMLGGLWVTIILPSPSSCSRRRRSAGTSSTPRTSTSSTTRTAT